MKPEVAKQLADQAERIFELIDAGILPDDKLFPRWFWVGHKHLCGYITPSEQEKFKCVTCLSEWTGYSKWDFGNGPKDILGVCSECGPKDGEVYILNYSHDGRWQCLSCKFEWDGEDGEICPHCNINYKDVNTLIKQR